MKISHLRGVRRVRTPDGRRTAVSAVALGLIGTGLTVVLGPGAQAAPGDGTIRVRVVQDFNANGTWEDSFVEPGLSGVSVEVTDAAGTTQTLTTDAEGAVSFAGAPGDYRVNVLNPDPSVYQPSFAFEGTPSKTPSATHLSSNEEFVTVAKDKTVDVTTGFWQADEYCQSNPLIVNACQPPIFNAGGGLANNPTAETLFTAPFRATGNDRGKEVLSTKADTGSVYGIGWRKQDRRIFAAAFAKRGVAYGPGGPGAIYTVSADGGATTLWGTVPGAGTTEHSFETASLRQDWDFADAVGKESLGDLDVSEDGDDLQVINLFDRKLYVYDAAAPTMGAPKHVVDLSANPGCSAASDWRPGALGERDGVLYVGGVCSAESTQNPADQRAIILTFDAETYAQTGTAMDQSINRKRELQWFLANNCLPRDTADGVNSTSFRPWSDTISCTHKNGGRLPDPQAWMDDIVVENNGDLVMAFRDRTGDQQMGANSRHYSDTDGGGTFLGTIDYVVAGDINKACTDGDGDFVLDINGGCGLTATAQTEIAPEYFGGDGGVHNEEAYGGLAFSVGERGIVSSAMDPAGGIFTQGYFRLDRETGRPLHSGDGGTKPDSPESLQANGANSGGNRITGGDQFSKGQGMADMEVLCDFAPIQFGNRIWNDTDGDGVQDAGEAGIGGVTVNLYDTSGGLVATTVTNARGEYYFDSVDDAVELNTSYVIRLDDPKNYEKGKPLDSSVYGLSPADQGADDLDTDATKVNDYPQIPVTTGGHGWVDHTLDAGFRPPPPKVSVGDYVWLDTDKDGVQDGGEKGIEGVVLVLTGPDGKPVTDVNGAAVGPVTTDANGLYSFDDLPVLPAGQSYTVSIDREASAEALKGIVPTKTGAGTSATDSSTWTATSGDLTKDGDRDPTLDFGFVPTPAVSVGDYVWLDTDRDGVQDAGEKGIEGVVLVLTGPDGKPVTDVNGAVVGPVTTDANGLYSFDGLPVLPAGQGYTVSIDREASAEALKGIVPTKTGAGTPATDSSTWTVTSGDLTEDGARDATLDFGFVPTPTVSVGDFVWLDTDGDGVQDAGEDGIEGVQLILTGPDGNPVKDVDGNVVGPVATDANGQYSFDGLPVLEPGQSYTVTLSRAGSGEALDGLIPTLPGVGGGATDSSTGSATSGDLTEHGDRDATLDFGFVPAPKVSVGDFVWLDLDGDGVQDAGEPGIEGVVLVLTGPDGQPVKDVKGKPVGPVTTDGSGSYTFANLPVLPAGQSYTVTIDQTASATALKTLTPSPTGNGTPGTDSSTWTASSGDLTVDGQNDPTLDFGFVPPPRVSVGDYVWVDTDNDGVQEPGEAGIGGVVLTLTGPDGKPVTDVDGNVVGPVTTDANGLYSFDDLPALPAGQHYTVTIDRDASAEALAPYVPTRSGAGTPATDSSTWTATSGDLTKNGDRDATLDFGFTQPRVSLGDFVWLDADNDGVHEEGEPGISGVVLKLLGPDGKPVTDVHGNPVPPTTTDANGEYSFDDLPVLPDGQSYTVVIDREASAAALAPYIPTAEGHDSRTWEATSSGLHGHGEHDPALVFGFTPPRVSLGDFVWLDTDRDGAQDDGEPGIQGVVLVLTGPDGKPVTDVLGTVVGPFTTGPDGRYSFDDLPLLAPGQSYTVSIDRDASADALKGVAPTTPGSGSWTWTATSTGLTQHGERDPGLDFGFVPVLPLVLPAPPGTLPDTGAGVDGPLLVAALASIVAGVVMLRANRRREDGLV